MTAATTVCSLFQAAIDRDVVEAAGPDAAGFLQGQLSQDVSALAVGASVYSLLLQPQGKVDAWLRVSRTGQERFLLDVDGGWGAAVVARLSRFKLRTRCELTLLEGWRCWAVRGGDAASLAAVRSAAAGAGDGAVVAEAAWPRCGGFDRLGAGIGPLDGVEVGDAAQYAAVRVSAGVPAMGAELDESVIPAEAGSWLIDRSVSFTKGCYTGQELVARVDSRGNNTPRKLRRLVASGELRAGEELFAEGEVMGVVTSAAPGGNEALGYCKRALEVPAAVVTAAGASVDVVELPGA